MPGRRQIVWFIAGFMASLLAVALFDLRPAAAQTRREAVSPTTQPSAPSRARAGQPSLDDSNAAPDMPGAIPGDDPSNDPVESMDADEPRPARGQRAVVRDGDLSHPGEAAVLRDGIVDTGEDPGPQDGSDPTTIDTRPPEDIAAFENPPAGHDPLLFQIEDMEPILDRRPARLFRFEPYDPVGIPVGSFILYPEAELAGVAFSNVLRSPNARSDVALDVRPSARLVSNWRAHALEFRASGVLTSFHDLSSEDDRAYTIEARGRLDISRRTNVQASLSREVTQESRSAIDASAAGPRAEVTTDKATLALNHRLNRLTLQLRGSVTGTDYSEAGASSNDDRDVTTYEQAVRASWEFKPSLSGFGEVALNQRVHEVAASTDGIARDSRGERYRIGVSFGNTGQVLRGEASIGYGRQRPDDARLSEVDGIVIDANVAWRVTPLTSLLFTARSDIAETLSAGSGGVQQQQVGLEVRHAFMRHLIGQAGVSYTWQDYEGLSLKESELRSTLGLEYYLSREAILFGRYQHISFDSSTPGSDYEADEVRIGMRVRR